MTREEVKKVLHSRTAHRVNTDSTLMSYKKDELVAIIRMLEHNWACAEATNDQQAENVKEYIFNNQWISTKKRKPKELEPVNIVWINKEPPPYYSRIKGKSFKGTGYYYNEKWWWYSAACEDYLSEFGESEADIVDDAIEITHWMPIPEPPKETENV